VGRAQERCANNPDRRAPCPSSTDVRLVRSAIRASLPRHGWPHRDDAAPWGADRCQPSDLVIGEHATGSRLARRPRRLCPQRTRTPPRAVPPTSRPSIRSCHGNPAASLRWRIDGEPCRRVPPRATAGGPPCHMVTAARAVKGRTTTSRSPRRPEPCLSHRTCSAIRARTRRQLPSRPRRRGLRRVPRCPCPRAGSSRSRSSLQEGWAWSGASGTAA
jgi:hypothetical protein